MKRLKYEEFLALPPHSLIFFEENYSDYKKVGEKIGQRNIACYKHGNCYNKNFQIDKKYVDNMGFVIYLAENELEKDLLKEIMGRL